MDKIEILERLISIKNNANERASHEARGNPILHQEIKAFILQCGIEQLIIEIQNTILAEYQNDRSPLTYKIRVSSQAS
ncbi:MAG: hypothetical protein VB084_05415 [Syntrophomonadaceae bacterium]|nr:hypothetical protein [Syntrophomonadaceae bacterium]